MANEVVQTTNNWELIQRQCRAFIDSGFLPNHIKSISQAITIAWKGHELGVPPLQAFSSITVINGKPCLSAELMLALIYTRVKGAKITFLTPPDKQNQECVVAMQRPDGATQTFRFSLEDAKRAGLQGNAWAKYPASMLRARAISAGARAVFPDAIMGCYTPEEMGAEPIDVDPIVAVEATPPKEELVPPKAVAVDNDFSVLPARDEFKKMHEEATKRRQDAGNNSVRGSRDTTTGGTP